MEPTERYARFSDAVRRETRNGRGEVTFNDGSTVIVEVRPFRCPDTVMGVLTVLTVGFASPLWLALALVDRLSRGYVALTMDDHGGVRRVFYRRRSLRPRAA